MSDKDITPLGRVEAPEALVVEGPEILVLVPAEYSNVALIVPLVVVTV